MVTYIIYCIINGKEIPIKVTGFMNTDIEKLDIETMKYKNKDELNLELMKKGIIKEPAEDFMIKYSYDKKVFSLPILYQGDIFIRESVTLKYKEYMLENPAIIRTKLREISPYVRARADFNKDIKSDNSDDLFLMALYEKTHDKYQNIAFEVEKLSRRLLRRYRDFRDIYFTLKAKNLKPDTKAYDEIIKRETLEDKYGTNYDALINEKDTILDEDYIIYDELPHKHR